MSYNCTSVCLGRLLLMNCLDIHACNDACTYKAEATKDAILLSYSFFEPWYGRLVEMARPVLYHLQIH